jgi:hypothetical protein
MAAPSEEKLLCDNFNLEALTVNQVKSFLSGPFAELGLFLLISSRIFDFK